jgi:uncharacterized delta-60 repeat protein
VEEARRRVLSELIEERNRRANPAGGRLDIAAVRLTSSGAIDTSFADGGAFVSSLGPTGSQTANAVTIDGSGRAVLAGKYGNAGPDDFGVLRLSAGGSLDPTFGITTIDFGGLGDIAQSVLLQEDGKLLVIGSNSTAISTETRTGVARLLADAGLDPTFGSAGRTSTPLPSGFSSGSTGEGAAMTSCGLVVVGLWTDPTPANHMALVKYWR